MADLPPTTTEPAHATRYGKLMGVNLNGVYLSRGALADLNAMFAANDQEAKGNYLRSTDAIVQLQDAYEPTFHYERG